MRDNWQGMGEVRKIKEKKKKRGHNEERRKRKEGRKEIVGQQVRL